MTVVVNPQWRRLDSQIRSKLGQRKRLHAEFGGIALSEGLSEEEMQKYQQRKGELQGQIQHLDVEIEGLHEQDSDCPDSPPHAGRSRSGS